MSVMPYYAWFPLRSLRLILSFILRNKNIPFGGNLLLPELHPENIHRIITKLYDIFPKLFPKYIPWD